MTLASDLQGDYLYIDGIEQVTFTNLDNEDTEAVYALRGGLNVQEERLAAAGAYALTDMTWELWSETLGSETPAEGCVVTDANSVAYTVITATETVFGTTSIKWRCVCRKRL
jgi:hypothetical protein